MRRISIQEAMKREEEADKILGEQQRVAQEIALQLQEGVEYKAIQEFLSVVPMCTLDQVDEAVANLERKGCE